MSAEKEGELSRFWQPFEALADCLTTASPQTVPAVLANLVDLVVGDLIPRLSAEEKVLLPLVSFEPESGCSIGLNHADVSRVTEALSTLALQPHVSDMARIRRTASVMLTVLGRQRQAEATLVVRIRALPAAGRRNGLLGDRLEEEAQASRAGQMFVSDADRLTTEAWVLRHNPKPALIGRVAPGRTSPVADLVAAIESA